MRLALLYSHPVQYAVPLFRELSRRPDIDLTVYFLSRQASDISFDRQFGCSFKWDIPLLEGYKYKFLRNLRQTNAGQGFFKFVNVEILSELRAKRYDALLVHGYDHFAKWLAFIAAKSCGTKLLLRGESHLNRPRGMVCRAMKSLILRPLFKAIDAFTYIGTLNRKYYEFYGVDQSRLYLAPYSVDSTFFLKTYAESTQHRPELRRALGVNDEAPVILYVGKLYDVKQPELLLSAFAEVRRRHKCHLVFVGDGPLRQRIDALSKASSVPDVHITGFVNQSQIPSMYICGDIFVLPSFREQWGLAINEAMILGLPIVTTDRVGCCVDLVEDGGNGFIVRYDDVGRLAERLEALVVNPGLRRAFGDRSREIISGWSIEKAADGIIRAAYSA